MAIAYFLDSDECTLSCDAPFVQTVHKCEKSTMISNSPVCANTTTSMAHNDQSMDAQYY